jgi:HSP20 family protein
MYVMTTRRAAEPFASLRRLNTLLDEAFTGWPGDRADGGALTAAWSPSCDIFEDTTAVKIVAEIPGVNPEDVKLSIENNYLTIRGEKRQQAEENGERVHRYERSYGAFERTFALPSTIDPDRIEARVEHGLLPVVLPKAERARPREIQVKVS